MKNIYLLFAVIAANVSLAQIPAGYYNSATGTGYTLKTQLHNIIDDHDAVPYSNIDDFFPIADRDIYYENDNVTILDPYSENPTGADPYNYIASDEGDQCGNYQFEGDCYNAEHVIPQSIFGQSEPMRGDAHHLLPTDGRVNGFRSNYPFGIVGTLVTQANITNPTQNGSKLGNNINTGVAAGYSGLVFEPINEFKGDVARIYFYFATRYQDVIPGWNAYAMFDGSTSKTIADPFLNILLTWHLQDPVSAKEIARNNAIYNYQGNRNPYIDHPEYVCNVWGTNCSLSNPTAEKPEISIYPVPSRNGKVFIQSADIITNIEVISINGQRIFETQNPLSENQTYLLEGLNPGFYFVKIKTADSQSIKKIIIE